MALRLVSPADHNLLREIYADAIETQAPALYTRDQVQAWAALAWLPGVLDRTLSDGVGWISGADEAFAMRYPEDRLALLYCRGRAARQGHARPSWIRSKRMRAPKASPGSGRKPVSSVVRCCNGWGGRLSLRKRLR